MRVLLLALLLSGCAVTITHVAEDGDVKYGFYPLGVRVMPQPGARNGVHVRSTTFGVMPHYDARPDGSWIAGLAFHDQREVYAVDDRVCGLGLIEAEGLSQEMIDAAIKSQVICAQFFNELEAMGFRKAE